jgi:hypothetical protein
MRIYDTLAPRFCIRDPFILLRTHTSAGFSHESQPFVVPAWQQKKRLRECDMLISRPATNRRPTPGSPISSAGAETRSALHFTPQTRRR